jgi:uncharacterized repeat protein (TIGR02543 family)
MKKRILILSILMAMTLTASATDFITDVMLLGNSNQTLFNEQLNELTAQGWTDIDNDLNAGCGSGSDYIHLLYKKQSSSGNTGVAITDFYIWAGDEDTHPSSLTIDGRTYNLVPYDGSDSFINSQGDLNNNAGGDYIHLYYTKDARVMNTGGGTITFHIGITDITFNNEQDGALGANGIGTGYDLNEGCGSGSAYIYMHVNFETGGNVVTLSSGSGNVQLQNGHILTGTGGADTKVTIADGATVTLSGVSITAIGNDGNHRWPGIGCLGDAVIILDEGTTNTVKGGYFSSGIYVPVNKTLSIQGSGTLNATGFTGAAGIGSGYDHSSCGNITISGGNITAKGGKYAAGIGSGYDHSSCGDITISGSTVTARGGIHGAGIGTGENYSSCGNITINGTVNASGDSAAAGIGGGYDHSSCGNITINDGIVNADGNAAGIGSGNKYSSCGDITISGGTVNATSGARTPGIGSGYSQSECGHITITQGVTRVTAIKGYSSYNVIGAGVESSCQSVTIGSVETGSIGTPYYTAPDPIPHFIIFPYYIAFDANGGTGEQADAQPFMYNVAQPLWSNIFTCTGYTFDGWATTPDGPKAYDNHQTVSNLADTIATVTLYARWKTQKAITGYGTGNSGWQLIASPMADAVTPTASNGFLANTYDLYYFDQTGGDNGKEWKNYKAHCNDAVNPFNALVSGKGYLYANSGNVTLIFNGTPYSGNGQVTLTKTNGYDFSGWNLIGNPFSTTATLDMPFYRMNSGGTALTAQVEANNSVAAMEGMFVQASTNNEKATFTPQSRQGGHNAVPLLNINLTHNQGEAIDNAILRFDGGQTLEKFSFREGSTKIYFPQGGTNYAIACAESTGEMPLDFEAMENGTYTLSVNVDNVELDYLHLIDNLTGADIDLLSTQNVIAGNTTPNPETLIAGEDPQSHTPSYTFTAKTTDYESRFKLVFSSVSRDADDDNAFAFISNGNIIVNGTGTLQVFDALDRQVMRKQLSTLNSQLSTANFPVGVYLLQLVSGDDVRTQKIVIQTQP